MTFRLWSNNQHRDMRNDRCTFQMLLGFLSYWAFTLTFFFLQVSKDLRTNHLGEIDARSWVSYNWTLALIELSEICVRHISQGRSRERSLNYLGNASRSLLILRRCVFGKQEKTVTIFFFAVVLQRTNSACQDTEGINIDIKIMRPTLSHVRFFLIHSRCSPAICHI